MSDKDIKAAVFAALRKLVIDPTVQEKFKQQCNHSVANYIDMLLSDKNSQDIIKLAAIINNNDDNIEKDNIQVVVKYIT
jgi:hypothetical protein